MFRSAIFFSYIIVCTANLLDEETLNGKPDLSSEVDDLWVLNLDNDALDFLKLRKETSIDEEFEAILESMIESFQHYGQRLKKPITKSAKDQLKISEKNKGKDDRSLKKEVMRIINKFVMSVHLDPDIHLSETYDEDPSLSLYFKGPYTALTVQSRGKLEWNYFIRPPSQFPSWFYEEHSNFTRDGQEMYVDVPKNVEKEFYLALLRILKMFLSLPV